MSNGTKSLFIFVIGFIAGGLVANAYIKDKYAKIAQEEIDSVKETFQKRMNREAGKIANKEVKEIRKTYNTYNNLVSNYSNGNVPTNWEPAPDDEEDEEPTDELEPQDIVVDDSETNMTPYPIDSQEFGVLEGYEQIFLTLYSDGVLADDNDEIVENPDEIVGKDYAKYFGSPDEPDVVVIRNNVLKADYEITRDLRLYSSVTWRPPHMI